MELLKANPDASFLDLEINLGTALMHLKRSRDMIGDTASDFKIMAAIRAIEEVRAAVIDAARSEGSI